MCIIIKIMNYNKITGDIGEETAVNYLIENNFIILERNYRYKRCEIDIIAKKDNCIHFIEVKIRKNNLFGYPENFVSDNQKNRIKLAAENYLYNNNWNNKILFDIISIEEKNNNIIFFIDAFF